MPMFAGIGGLIAAAAGGTISEGVMQSEAAKAQLSATQQYQLEAARIGGEKARSAGETFGRQTEILNKYGKAQESTLTGAYMMGSEALKSGFGAGQEALLTSGMGAFGALREGLTSGAVGGRDVTQARSRFAEAYDKGFQFNETNPAYQARLRAGAEARNMMSAAQGGRGGSRALRSMERFGQDLASQEYEAQFQRNQQTLGQAAGVDAQQQGLLTTQVGMERAAEEEAVKRRVGAGSELAGVISQLGKTGAEMAVGQGKATSDLIVEGGTTLSGFYGNERTLRLGQQAELDSKIEQIRNEALANSYLGTENAGSMQMAVANTFGGLTDLAVTVGKGVSGAMSGGAGG